MRMHYEEMDRKLGEKTTKQPNGVEPNSIQLEVYDEMWLITNVVHYSYLIGRQGTFHLSQRKVTAMKLHPW